MSVLRPARGISAGQELPETGVLIMSFKDSDVEQLLSHSNDFALEAALSFSFSFLASSFLLSVNFCLKTFPLSSSITSKNLTETRFSSLLQVTLFLCFVFSFFSFDFSGTGAFESDPDDFDFELDREFLL